MDKIDEIAKLLKEQNRLIKTMTAEIQLNNDLLCAQMKRKAFANSRIDATENLSVIRKYENLRKTNENKLNK